MSNATTARDAIIECFQAHATLTVGEVKEWIDEHYPGRWKDIGTTLADLTIQGNQSAGYRKEQKCLVRVRRRTYRLAVGSTGTQRGFAR